jgi:biofilm protein TabA
MLIGHLEIPETGEALLRGQVWGSVFEWLKRASADEIKGGEYLIRGHDVYVKAQGYQTVPRDEARFEVHRQYIDVQCALEGAEAIEWYPANELEKETEYDKEKDVWFVKAPRQASRAIIFPRFYAIFWPGEAHMPKLRVRGVKDVFKVCVKIRAEILK